MSDKFMKVYASKFWGDDVALIGNREAFIALKRVIEDALEDSPKSTHYEVFYEKLGEIPYELLVKVVNDDLINYVNETFPTHCDDGDSLREDEVKLLQNFLDYAD